MSHSSLLSASHIVEAITEKRTWMTKISNPESPDNADHQALSEVLTQSREADRRHLQRRVRSKIELTPVDGQAPHYQVIVHFLLVLYMMRFRYVVVMRMLRLRSPQRNLLSRNISEGSDLLILV